MGKNIYKTSSGQYIDIDTLRLVNESVLSVGNMPVNARGDEVRPDGTVIKSRNEIMKEHYNRNIETVVKYNPNKRRQSDQEVSALVPDQADVAQTTVPVTNSVPAPENDSTLRGSLASSVSIDLVQDPAQPKRTITRI